MNYTDINAKTWDRWSEEGMTWTRPITHEEYAAVTVENYIVYLTPCMPVPHTWFGDLSGKKLLGLASGGGQQMPVFAKLGADCTLLDYSDRQLGSDRAVAEREGYAISIVKADMTKRLPFDDASFDIIFHPVSNCYIEDVQHVWNECYRVLRPGGVLLAGMDNGMNFLFAADEEPLTVVNRLPYNPLKLPKEDFEKIAAEDGVQFSHTLEEQIGGQLKAGFLLRALYEDRDREGCGVIREYAPQYYATMAVKE
ncbi:MAG: class I SAM-dependent methyltransferase [Clostridia bacterium]|nr:class I SAM-dependent methyltransferase [Clostridia bacterium]